MRRVLSILAAIAFLVANVGAAPVPDHQQPQGKTPTNPKVTASARQVKSSQPSKTAKGHKAQARAYQVGNASWYGKQFHGRTTASGEDFDMFELTAAHRQLPLGTYVKVTNLRNGKWIVVRVNDRGPYVANRIMDLSYSAARMLNFHGGIEKVRLDLIQPATMASNQSFGAN
jgi:rare lipoprotein A